VTNGKTDQGFPLPEAMALLAEAELLLAVLLPGANGLCAHEPTEARAVVNSAFVGARLDSRLLQPGELFVALAGDNTHGRRFAPAWLARGGLVLTDTSSDTEPLLGLPVAAGGGVLVCADPQRALAVLAGAWRERMSARIVGITGTNGKTTTKDFLAALLAGAGPTLATAGNFNNFLGLPLTLLELAPDHRYAVIEMGASAEGEIDVLASLARPEVGVITNAAPAHLAQFGSLEGVIAGKGELLDHLPTTGTAILNADSPGYEAWCERARCPVVSFGQQRGEHRWRWSAENGKPSLLLDGAAWPIPLPGAHNAANLAAAILAAREVGAGWDEIRAGLHAFQGSPHRGIVLDIAGRTVLDDAYNANPASVAAAVKALLALGLGNGAGRRFAVLGHMAELGDDSAEIHYETGRQLAGTGLDVLLAVGPQARPLREGFDAAAGDGHYCAALEAAAGWLASNTRAGDQVLVKGSRSAGMERILTLLATSCGAANGNQD